MSTHKQTCAVSDTEFTVTQKDCDFYTRMAASFGGVTFDIPMPTQHPNVRHAARVSQKNTRALYTRSCDMCHQGMHTSHEADVP